MKLSHRYVDTKILPVNEVPEILKKKVWNCFGCFCRCYAGRKVSSVEAVLADPYGASLCRTHLLQLYRSKACWFVGSSPAIPKDILFWIRNFRHLKGKNQRALESLHFSTMWNVVQNREKSIFIYWSQISGAHWQQNLNNCFCHWFLGGRNNLTSSLSWTGRKMFRHQVPGNRTKFKLTVGRHIQFTLRQFLYQKFFSFILKLVLVKCLTRMYTESWKDMRLHEAE